MANGYKAIAIYIFSILSKSEEINEIILDIYYSPCQKRLEVHPLRVASNNNIYGDTSREAVDGFLRSMESQRQLSMRV